MGFPAPGLELSLGMAAGAGTDGLVWAGLERTGSRGVAVAASAAFSTGGVAAAMGAGVDGFALSGVPCAVAAAGCRGAFRGRDCA